MSLLPEALLRAAHETHVAVANAKAAIDGEQQKLVHLEIEQRTKMDERTRLRDRNDRENAIRYLDGEDALPKQPSRASKLAALDSSIPALEAAIRIQTERIAERQEAKSLPQMPFISAILDILTEIQTPAVADTRVFLTGLAEPFARLIAADQIRNATIGERFPMPNGRTPPFSGLIVVRKFISAIPERFRPPELDEGRLLNAANAISSSIIQQIKGTHS